MASLSEFAAGPDLPVGVYLITEIEGSGRYTMQRNIGFLQLLENHIDEQEKSQNQLKPRGHQDER